MAWTDYKITRVISVCLSVCVSTLSRSQFLTDFDDTWHRHLEPDTKETFRWGQYPIRVTGCPLFLPNFTPNWHLHNAFLNDFSMAVLKHFSDDVYGPIIAVHSSNDVVWRPQTPICQKRVKGHDQGHVTP